MLMIMHSPMIQRLELLDLQILQEELTIEHAKVLQALESQAKLREKWLAKKKQTQDELEKMQSMLAKEWVDLPEYQNMWTDLKASMKKLKIPKRNKIVKLDKPQPVLFLK